MKNGGTGLNASTSRKARDITDCLQQGRASNALEADRMRNAYFRHSGDVVMEERRLSENSRHLFREQVGGRLLRRFPLPLGRYRLDGRPQEDDQGRHDRISQPVLHPQQRRGHLCRRRETRSSSPWPRNISGPSPGPRRRADRTSEPPPVRGERMYGKVPSDQPSDDVPHPAGHPDAAPLTVLAGILGAGGGRGGFGGPAAEAAERAAWRRSWSGKNGWPSRSRRSTGPNGTSARSSWRFAPSGQRRQAGGSGREIWAEIENIKTDVTGDEIKNQEPERSQFRSQLVLFRPDWRAPSAAGRLTGAGARSSPTMRPSRT